MAFEACSPRPRPPLAPQASDASSPWEEAKARVLSGNYTPVERGRKKNPERAAKRRQQRAADAEYRARENAKCREWYAKNKAKKYASNLAYLIKNPDKHLRYIERAAEIRKEKAAAAHALKRLKLENK